MRKIAGRQKYFRKSWERITRNRMILKCIEGYSISFESQPVQGVVPTTPLLQGSQYIYDVKREIDKLRRLGAIRPCRVEDSRFISL